MNKRKLRTVILIKKKHAAASARASQLELLLHRYFRINATLTKGACQKDAKWGIGRAPVVAGGSMAGFDPRAKRP